MATKIVTKNSSTAASVPTAGQLVQGELAVNVADKKLYTKDSGGTVVELGINPTTIDINAGTIDGTPIGATTPSTGVFTNVAGTLITAAQPNITSLGTITSLVATTADINGGTIDGTTIGASSASTGAFTSLAASGEIVATGGIKITETAGGTFLKFDVDGTTDEATVGMDATDLIIDIDPTNARSSSDFVVKNDGTENFRISSNGGATFTGDITATGGVYLGGTAAANLLDYYEEGTWTPVFSDAAGGGNDATAGTSEGHYIRVGNVVTATVSMLNISPTGLTAANTLYIKSASLPFAAVSYATADHWTAIVNGTNTFAVAQPVMVKHQNGSGPRFGTLTSNTSSYLDVDEVLASGGGTDMRFSWTYFTS
jgi:hypothetical protein